MLPVGFAKEYGERVVDRWRTVAISHMVKFSDVDEAVTGKEKKKR